VFPGDIARFAKRQRFSRITLNLASGDRKRKKIFTRPREFDRKAERPARFCDRARYSLIAATSPARKDFQIFFPDGAPARKFTQRSLGES